MNNINNYYNYYKFKLKLIIVFFITIKYYILNYLSFKFRISFESILSPRSTKLRPELKLSNILFI